MQAEKVCQLFHRGAARIPSVAWNKKKRKKINSKNVCINLIGGGLGGWLVMVVFESFFAVVSPVNTLSHASSGKAGRDRALLPTF